MDEELREAIELRGDGFKVDAAKRMITGVSLLSEHSANGYDYDRQAMQDAVKLYEGVKVFFGHDGKRGPLDVEAIVRSPRYVLEQNVGRIRGDLEVGPGAGGDKLLWLAQSAPDTVGMSHVIKAKVAA